MVICTLASEYICTGRLTHVERGKMGQRHGGLPCKRWRFKVSFKSCFAMSIFLAILT